MKNRSSSGFCIRIRRSHSFFRAEGFVERGDRFAAELDARLGIRPRRLAHRFAEGAPDDAVARLGEAAERVLQAVRLRSAGWKPALRRGPTGVDAGVIPTLSVAKGGIGVGGWLEAGATPAENRNANVECECRMKNRSPSGFCIRIRRSHSFLRSARPAGSQRYVAGRLEWMLASSRP
jgi:hypothetical protein